MHHRLARAGERLDLAGEPYGAAIHRHRQQWLHENVCIAGQAGDKRDAQFELSDLVMSFLHAVVENDIALMHADVVDREACR